jgi:hypothetical protein
MADSQIQGGLMHKSGIVLGFGLAMVTAAVALAQTVTTDYDKSADFTTYKTFMWIKEPTTRNPLMQQRIVDDVNAALTGKGLQVATENADIGIAAHSTTKEEKTLNSFCDGFGGGWRWRWGCGGFGPTTIVNTYEVGTLVVDLFDARTKEALWRGVASKTISDNPQKNVETLHKAVAKMFQNFPPSSQTKAK